MNAVAEAPVLHNTSEPRKRIAFLAGTLGKGGAEQQLYYMLRALKNAGHDLKLLCLTHNEFWQEPIQRLEIPVVWVGQSHARLARVRTIIQELRAFDPGLIQSAHFYTNLYAVAAGRVLGVPEIGAIRNDVWNEIQDGNPFLGRLNLRMPRLVAANSKAGAETAISLGVARSRCFFLPNVVDTDRFSALTPHAGPVHLLAAARLVEQKKLDRFLRVIHRLRKQAQTPPFSASIAGGGPLETPLKALAAELGLGSDILTFEGPVAELAPVYRRANIFVLTSDYEGAPNVILEAMASGLPVVATSVGGVPEIIQDGETGFIVAPGDEEALCTTLLRLMNDSGLRETIGAAARQYVLEQRSVHRLPSYLDRLHKLVLA